MLAEIGNDRGDVVEAAGRVRIAQQIERRQFGGRDLHVARIRLVVFDACADGRHVLAVIEGDADRPARIFGSRLSVTTWNSMTA